MFLLAANRMSRGYARLRQWLIMAMRMAAIAGSDLRRQPAACRRLAGPGRRRPRRHDDHPARPLAQHAAGRRRGAGVEARDRRAAAGANARDAGLGPLGADREHHQQAARARVDRRPLDLDQHRPGQLRRPTCRPCCWPPATTSRPTRPAAPRSGSAPTCARTTGMPRAAAGRCCATGSSSCSRASGSTCWPTPSPHPKTCRCG